MHGLRQKHVEASGVRIAFLEREADAATPAAPILLLHGLLATAHTLTELIDGLPTDRRIVAIDLLSAHPLDRRQTLDVHFAALAGLVHEFMHIVGLHQPVVIGHSHGGVITLKLAATHRHLFRGLVLLCPAHPFGGYRSHVVNFYLTRWGRTLALSIPLAPNWMILRAYNEAAGSKRRIHMKHLRPYLPVLRNRNTLRKVLQILATWDADMDVLRTALVQAPLDTPTLLIWGDEDPVVPISTAADLAPHLLNHERATLPGMGHLLAEEAPAECLELIHNWLLKLDGRSE